jgi:hypothetical protein
MRVCAPFELRVKRMMERLNTDDRDFVENEIRMSEEAHGAITRRHFGVSWEHADLYDLVLNTERLSVDECADAVMEVLDDPNFQETTDSRRVMRDLAVAAHVRSALRQDPRTDKLRISITADNGVVALAGLFDNGQDPKDATDVATKVPGVRGVVNELRGLEISARHIVEG